VYQDEGSKSTHKVNNELELENNLRVIIIKKLYLNPSDKMTWTENAGQVKMSVSQALRNAAFKV
jgi:hypothetical protein